MKRVGDMMTNVAERGNLVMAFRAAVKGKRTSGEAQSFMDDLDSNLNRLLEELRSGEWTPDSYRRFVVRGPKIRVIHAAPFRDRVVHHALMRIAGPAMERGASAYSFACRRGKGSLAALHAAARHTRADRSFLQLDVRKYFDSVHHETLADLLRGRFKDGGFLEIMGRIIGGYEHGKGTGLPIGTLTSQYLANFYLDGLDRFCFEELKVRRYVRYMDDFVLWHPETQVLTDWCNAIEEWVHCKRRLSLKTRPEPQPCASGIPFVGYRVVPGAILLGRRARRRYRSRIRGLLDQHARAELSALELQRRTDALNAFVDVANGRSWRTSIVSQHAVEMEVI